MYMGWIAEIDGKWHLTSHLENNEDGYGKDEVEEMCLDKFHRWRTLQPKAKCKCSICCVPER